MKHDKYELTHKKFIKAEKRLNEIYKEIRNLPYRELEKPYQEGWFLQIVLRDDLLKSDKGPFIQLLVDKYCTRFVTKNPKFISKIRQNPALSSVRKLFFNKHGLHIYYNGPHIRSLDKREYNKLTDLQKKYFDLDFHSKYTGREEYSMNLPEYYLRVKVKKRIVTHVQDINPLLLQEQAELKSILAPYWRARGYGQGYYHWRENRAERRKSKVELTKIDENGDY